MPLLDRKNLLAAQQMYYQRLGDLKVEVQRLIREGAALGQEYETTVMSALDVLEEEVQGIEECISLLNRLLQSGE